jgi:hypothetical protein
LELFAWFYAVQEGRKEPSNKIRDRIGKGVFDLLRILAWTNNSAEILTAKLWLFALVIAAAVGALFKIMCMWKGLFGTMVARMIGIMIGGMFGIIVILGSTDYFAGGVQLS